VTIRVLPESNVAPVGDQGTGIGARGAANIWVIYPDMQSVWQATFC